MNKEKVKASLTDDLHRLMAENKKLREALVNARNELGVPDENYPAPVVNAVDIINEALRGSDD